MPPSVRACDAKGWELGRASREPEDRPIDDLLDQGRGQRGGGTVGMNIRLYVGWLALVDRSAPVIGFVAGLCNLASLLIDR